jgi:hypothetical protein
MTPRELEEYRALRSTIRERGTARICLFVLGMVAWAGIVLASAALSAPPVGTLLPLLVLAATFEAIFALHTGVERIGRYLQVFLEEGTGWERVVMAYGQSHPGGPDPLFTVIFLAATGLTLLPALVAEPVAVEIVAIGAAHLGVVARILAARRQAARQRAIDLDGFGRIRANSAPAPS